LKSDTFLNRSEFHKPPELTLRKGTVERLHHGSSKNSREKARGHSFLNRRYLRLPFERPPFGSPIEEELPCFSQAVNVNVLALVGAVPSADYRQIVFAQFVSKFVNG